MKRRFLFILSLAMLLTVLCCGTAPAAGAFSFITQPKEDNGISFGEDCTIDWETNFTPTRVELGALRNPGTDIEEWEAYITITTGLSARMSYTIPFAQLPGRYNWLIRAYKGNDFATSNWFVIECESSCKCGDNVEASFERGVLTISGTGPMWDFTSASSVPWHSFCGSISSVVIRNGVTAIGERAFSDCTSLTGITMPDSIKRIEEGAFQNCTALKNVTIPNGVTHIGTRAFAGCASLTNVSIPESVTVINSYAFSFCTSLTGVILPKSLTTIRANAFAYNSGMISIQVNSGNPVYSSSNGVLYNKQKTELVIYPCGKTGSFRIPDSVTSIGPDAFYSCEGLTGVTIPNSVTNIGNDAFSCCTGLTEIRIPGSVTSIGEYAFYGCTGLTGMILPDGVASIKNNTFGSCTGLESVVIPKSVTSIEEYAFYGCEGLTGITIPGNVVSIGARAFCYCTALANISLPKSVMNIEAYAFANCSSLAGVTIHNPDAVIGDGNQNVFRYAAAGFTLRGHSGSTAEAYAAAVGHAFAAITAEMGTPNFTFPAALSCIENEAFAYSKAAVVWIPDTVNELGSKAFAYCTSLTQIRIPPTITEIPSDIFQGITKSKITIFGVPGSEAETFANNAGIRFEIE